jgi:alpha-1,3-mannosylglycoprotein beta-1,4-N-acetylglucosaminyltransferase A/B
VKWRSKQNLDYAYLMMYAEDRGRFYLQLEDDVLTGPSFVSAILEAANSRTAEGKEWFDIHFFVGGFIGKLFRDESNKI